MLDVFNEHMSHSCEVDPSFSRYYLTWMVRWIKHGDSWRLYKVCSKCAANPECKPQFLVSVNLDNSMRPLIEHLIFHVGGPSPIGDVAHRYLALEIGIVTKNWWEVISVKEVKDPRTIEMLDRQVADQYVSVPA